MSKENKYTNEDLKTMQAWDLQKKIQVTKTRIIEWYEHYNGKVYVSFSGGKDSTVLLDLVRSIYPDVEAVFLDTGLEYPEIRDFVKTKENVTWLKPDMNFRKVIEKYGYPVISKEVSKRVYYAKKGSKWAIKSLTEYDPNTIYNFQNYKYLLNCEFNMSNKCCDIMKKKPAHKFDKESEKTPFIATMAVESQQRKRGWLKVGCNAFDKERASSQPISFWTEQDVLHYLKDFNISYCSVYGDIVYNDKNNLITTGETRTGCMFCMYGCHLEKSPNRFQRMAETHPIQYNYCMKPWEEGGLGLAEVLGYIGVDYKPIKKDNK